ncbi:hypothetical protein BGZ49_003165 [Haplosporangium sp. Z 27]|nr:hypothetical protein BGZ49_003165 [Haplosporangium sp. Z 27]
MAPISNTRVIRAQHIPHGGKFSTENVKVETIEITPELKDGDILIRNIYIALDPFVRYSFTQKYGLDSTLGVPVNGWGIGEVIESKSSAYPVNSFVVGFEIGWEQYTLLSNPRALWIIPDAQNPKLPITEYANTLGANGLTAYATIETYVKFKKDQVVFISSAAGPVGAFFAILAKRQGAYVIGSAGSDEKIEYITKELGVDAGINYKTKDLRAELGALAPKGIDIYFDQVGGETLDIVLENLKDGGQVLAIGNMSLVEPKTSTPFVSKYLNDLGLIIGRNLTINGLSLFNHLYRFPKFWEEYAPLIASGEIKKQKLTVVKGLENSAQAFIDYLEGKYHGKVVIEL